MVEEDGVKPIDDDSFLDWEHRPETFPFHKHMIAGITIIFLETLYRLISRHNGACRDVSIRYCKGK